MVEFLGANWHWLLPVVILVADKIVKYTPTKKDDFIFDILVKGLFRKVPGLKKLDLRTKRPA